MQQEAGAAVPLMATGLLLLPHYFSLPSGGLCIVSSALLFPLIHRRRLASAKRQRSESAWGQEGVKVTAAVEGQMGPGL